MVGSGPARARPTPTTDHLARLSALRRNMNIQQQKDLTAVKCAARHLNLATLHRIFSFCIPTSFISLQYISHTQQPTTARFRHTSHRHASAPLPTPSPRHDKSNMIISTLPMRRMHRLCVPNQPCPPSAVTSNTHFSPCSTDTVSLTTLAPQLDRLPLPAALTKTTSKYSPPPITSVSAEMT